jgi:MFS family permease
VIAPREAAEAMSAAPAITVDFDWKQHRKYLLLMLFVAYFLNSIDRNIINILQQSIKEEFALMDWQLGIMTGFAFALFYNLIGIPTARFIDGGAIRTAIVSGGVAVWSVATALCGAAQNYWQLLLARAGVGVGEGTFGPAVVTLISDYWGPTERAQAIGTYILALPLASLVGLTLGGWIAETYGWRMALLVVGLPGLAVALLFKLTIKEPPRGLADGKFVKLDSALSIGEVFRTVTRKKTVVHLLIAVSVGSFGTVGGAVWFPPYFQRAFGLNMAEIGATWGIITGLAGAIGAFAMGWFADRMGVRHPRWYMLLPALAMLVSFPMFILASTVGNFWLSVAFFLVPAIFNNAWIPVAMSSTQGLAPLAMRALLGMFVTLAANLVGHGFAPPIIGALSDLYAGWLGDSAVGLRWALITSSLFYLLAAVSFWMASRDFAGDLEK